jgi:LDH2 family malate/lactate/ureidoglycolate dehydrogenase
MNVVSAEVLRRQIGAVFLAWGMEQDYVDTTMQVMVETDLRGIDSHGIGMLPTYDRWYRQGKINVRPEIKVLNDGPSTALIDGDHGLGHVPSVRAIELAVAKCRDTGLGCVPVCHSNHFGAAGYYTQLAAERGCVGMAMTGTPAQLVVPTFGREPMFGTNPIAFAAPATRNPSFALDMATSTVAFGKINIARRAGKPLPEGWALDEDGQPITDSQAAFTARRLTPLGGTRELGSHKGYGLAIVVEILSSILTGSVIGGIDLATGAPGEQSNVGHFFLAINPDLLRDAGEFGDDMDRLIDMLHATPRADEDRPVQVAGDPEHAAYAERSETGIPISDTLYDEVRAIAGTAGVPFLLGN